MPHVVVTYHYVRPFNSDGVTGLTPAEFAGQIRLIQRTHRIVGVDEFIRTHQSETNLALLTFDDALRDQYEHAAPVMADLRVPCVLFSPMRPYATAEEITVFDRAAVRQPPAGAADARWCTQHLLHALAQELGWAQFEQRVDAYLDAAGGVVIDVDRMNRLYHYEVPAKRRLKYTFSFALPYEQGTQVLHCINERVGLRAADWYCTKDQLNELQSAGHALGGHGFDHVAYTTLSPVRQAADMQAAQTVMSREFGTRPRALAYPFGQFDAATVTIAERMGYTHQFDTKGRVDAKFLAPHLAQTSHLLGAFA